MIYGVFIEPIKLASPLSTVNNLWPLVTRSPAIFIFGPEYKDPPIPPVAPFVRAIDDGRVIIRDPRPLLVWKVPRCAHVYLAFDPPLSDG